MILIISHEKDEHSREVQRLLEQRGHPYDLLDLSCFPAEAHLSIYYDSNKYVKTYMEHNDKIFEFHNYRSIWWRRPQPFTLHEEMKGPVEINFTHGECHCAVNGMWLLPSARWINHPVNDEVAARKVHQLRVAAELGLPIPKTCITNNPARALEFIRSLGIGNVIYKSFSATEQAWRETRLVKEDELDKIENVKYAPVIFQECIHADFDLRITVIGDKIFPSVIYSQDTSYKVDYRMNYSVAKIVEYKLPETVNKKLLQFMRKLGLVYGAIDMRRNKNGDFIFLEVNPAGQWLFMEQPTGMPITNALVDKLIEFDATNDDQHHNGVREHVHVSSDYTV